MAHLVVDDEIDKEIEGIATSWKMKKREVVENLLRSQLSRFSEAQYDKQISELLSHLDVPLLVRDGLRCFLLNLYRKQGLLSERDIPSLLNALPKTPEVIE